MANRLSLSAHYLIPSSTSRRRQLQTSMMFPTPQPPPAVSSHGAWRWQPSSANHTALPNQASASPFGKLSCPEKKNTGDWKRLPTNSPPYLLFSSIARPATRPQWPTNQPPTASNTRETQSPTPQIYLSADANCFFGSGHGTELCHDEKGVYGIDAPRSNARGWGLYRLGCPCYVFGPSSAARWGRGREVLAIGRMLYAGDHEWRGYGIDEGKWDAGDYVAITSSAICYNYP